MKKYLQHIYLSLIIGSGLLLANPVQAQQDSQYTQYMYNTMSLNPAYAGSRGSLSVMGLYRTQWVGMDGAPKTIDFSAHSPIGVQGVGLGLGFNSDQIGPSTQSEIDATFSYTLNLNSNNLKLAFGLTGGLSLLDVDPNKLNIHNPNDYDLRLSHHAAPRVGVGFYLYKENWYIGLSTPNLLETKYYGGASFNSQSKGTLLFNRWICIWYHRKPQIKTGSDVESNRWSTSICRCFRQCFDIR